jgi:hypothetical protein
MSISSSQNSVTYAGNDSTEYGYGIPFVFHDVSWLRVFRAGPSGERIRLDAGIDFTISGTDIFTTTEIPETDTITVARLAPTTQELSLTPNSPLPAEALEKALDGIIMAVQDHTSTGSEDPSDTPANSIAFPFSEPAETVRTLPDAAARENSILTFDEDGGVGVTPIATVVSEASEAVLAELDSHSLNFPEGESSDTNRTLPAAADRKDCFLTFDADDGDLTVTSKASLVSEVSDLVLAEVGELTGEVEGTSFARTNTTNTFSSLNTFAAGVAANTVSISGNSSVGGTLGVTGASSLSTLTTSGAGTIGGNLSVSGNTTTTGSTTTASLSVSGNSTLTGTLGVTGNSSLSGTLNVTGGTTASTLSLSGNASVGGTLGVTGKATLASAQITGTADLDGTTTAKTIKVDKIVANEVTPLFVPGSGSNVDWDLSLGNLATLALTKNLNLRNPTNITPGTYVLKITRTGTSTLSFGSKYRFTVGPVARAPTANDNVYVFQCFAADSDLYATVVQTTYLNS